ncbi:MAG TPA: class II fructose-bisphosphatase [Polyangia bacterium]|jgi:fructose-1,6-bisphosphatase II|nr:class II fructose-bisphosphatase [Polyangia bacterium]
MDRNLALEVVRVTEAAALASARFVGLGDHDGADQAATQAMRETFGSLRIRGTVVIGEGERDEAPMLYIGEELGDGAADSPAVDIAVDPLEGTNLCANGAPGALAVVAMAEHGRFLNAPDTYMEKLAVGSAVGPGVVDIRRTPTENLAAIARKKGVDVEDLTAVILDRPRHAALIAEVRAAGARIRLITDGDVGGAIATSDPAAGIDVLMGTGGAPEGVLAAAALRCMNGYMQGILRPRNDAEVARVHLMGIPDVDHVFEIGELAAGDVMFAATGITGGFLLRGVQFLRDGAQSSSLVMRSRSGTVRHIHTRHRFTDEPNYAPSRTMF